MSVRMLDELSAHQLTGDMVLSWVESYSGGKAKEREKAWLTVARDFIQEAKAFAEIRDQEIATLRQARDHALAAQQMYMDIAAKWEEQARQPTREDQLRATEQACEAVKAAYRGAFGSGGVEKPAVERVLMPPPHTGAGQFEPGRSIFTGERVASEGELLAKVPIRRPRKRGV